MKKVTVKLPGGDKVRVTAPDNAKDDEVISFVREKLTREALEKDIKKNSDALAKQAAELEKLKTTLSDMTRTIGRLVVQVDRIENRKIPEPNIKIMPDPDLAEAIEELRKARPELERFDIEKDENGRIKSIIPVVKK